MQAQPIQTTMTQGASFGSRQFLANFRAAIIVLSGDAIGMEFALDQRRVVLGRGPGVDLALDEPSLAGRHAELELCEAGFRLRSLAEPERCRLGGAPVQEAVLKSEDRFQLGDVSFEYVVESRPSRSDA